MPTTRSGAQYGPSSPKTATVAKQILSVKRKETVLKTYSKAKAKQQVSKYKPAAKNVGKKRESLSKRSPIKASKSKTKKISKAQATKRKESVDKRRFRDKDQRIQDNGEDYPDGADSSTSLSIPDQKPGYIFILQEVDPDNDNQPVEMYKIEVIGQGETLPQTAANGAFVLNLMPSTCYSVANIDDAKEAVLNSLSRYRRRIDYEGWLNVSEEELNTFICQYNNFVSSYKA